MGAALGSGTALLAGALLGGDSRVTAGLIEANRTVEPIAAVVVVAVDVCGSGIERRAIGVAVGPELVATVAHTFARGASFRLIDHDDRRWDAELVRLDAERDLALLRLDEPAPAWLELGDTTDGADLRVFSLRPDRGPVVKPARLVRHVVATLDGIGRRAALELEAEIEPGDSGSPVLDQAGQVVGLVFAAARTAPGPLPASPVVIAAVPSDAEVNGPRAWAVAASELADALTAPLGEPVPLGC